MNSLKNNLSTFTLYFLAFTLALYFLYEYLVIAYYAIACSGLMKPDTNLGGNITAREVFNEETTSVVHG
jgi:hypothetical protein